MPRIVVRLMGGMMKMIPGMTCGIMEDGGGNVGNNRDDEDGDEEDL